MIRVRFWGCRGSVASPGRSTARYGGNTACVHVVGYDSDEPGAAAGPDNPHVILDGGTGLALLQSVLMRGPLGRGKGHAHILLTHFHWDHLIGLPFFAPLFIPGNKVSFYGACAQRVQSSIERLFTSVYSPIKGTEHLAAELEYRKLDPSGENVAGFDVNVANNRHPGGALSIRLDYGDRSVVYSTDHEIGDEAIDDALVELARGADLWIMDAQYRPEQLARHVGWGHSSHIEAVQLALRAKVNKMALFHHKPDHDDHDLDRMGLEAQQEAKAHGLDAVVARDGLVMDF